MYMSDYLDPNNEELLRDFFMEAQMQVESIERNILALEENPGDMDAVDEVFRAAHTLKGGSATVQMNELSSFTHQMEDLLDEVRGGSTAVESATVDTLLNAIDVIKAMLEARQNGEVYGQDYSAVSAALQGAVSGGAPPEPPEEKAQPSSAPSQPAVLPGHSFKLTEYEQLELKEAAGEGVSIVIVRASFDEDNPMNTVGGIQMFARLKDMGQILKTEPDFDALYEDRFHPVVDYFLATDKEQEYLRTEAFIPDVTLSIHVAGIDDAVLVDIGELRDGSFLDDPVAGSEEDKVVSFHVRNGEHGNNALLVLEP